MAESAFREMHYAGLLPSDEACYTEQERAECMQESAEICHDLAERGGFIAASPLHPVATATSVRVRDGVRQVTDGPFAETSEQLGGYYVIDVPNLDDAIALASRIPPAKKGTVEIRPIFELASLPQA